MCQHCKDNTVRVDEKILDALIISSNLKPEDLTGLKQKTATPLSAPDFKPDTMIGEGEPTKDEIEYREALLDLLRKLYDKINKIIFTDKDPSKKVDNIDKPVQSFIKDGQKLVDKHIPRIWNDGIDEGIRTLEKIDKDNEYDPDKIDTFKLELILLQQKLNIRKIGLNLRGRIEQHILIKAIQQHKKQSTSEQKSIIKANPTSNWTECMRELHKIEPDLTEDELRDWCGDYVGAWGEAQGNTDKAGMFGWIEAHKEAILGALILGIITMDRTLVADWVTAGDDRVCSDCLKLEANSPYNVDEWPEEPHFGCRCEQENVRTK